MEGQKQQQIGFHKGALKTLMEERKELTKMISTVDKLAQMHIKSLEKLGVDINYGEEGKGKKGGPQKQKKGGKSVDEKFERLLQEK